MSNLEKIISNLDIFESYKPGDDIDSLLKTNVIEPLQYSILAGEFYLPDSATILENIVRKMLDVEVKFPKTEITAGATKIFQLLRVRYFPQYTVLIETVSNNLKFFLSKIDAKAVDTKHLLEYKLKLELLEIFQLDSIDDTNFIESIVFEINIYLAYVDEYLECNEKHLNDLGDVIKFLEDTDTNEITEDIISLLIQKANFLSYKIKARDQLKTKSLQFFDLKIEQSSAFYPFYKKVINHYKDFKLDEIRVEEFSIANEKEGFYKYDHFHHISRAYNREKLSIDNKEKLKSTLNILQSRRTSPELATEFNTVAYYSIINLIKNAELSQYLKTESNDYFKNILNDFSKYILGEKSSCTADVLENAKDILDRLVKDNNLPDFFCYKTFIEFLDELTSFLTAHPNRIFLILKSEEGNKTIQERGVRIHSLIKYIEVIYKETINGLRENFDKLRTHEAKPVYMPMKECIEEFELQDGRKVEIFLRSSYVLPNNFEKLKLRISNYELYKAVNINPLSNILSYTSNRVHLDNKIILFEEEIKEKSENFKKQVKDNEIKLVQIVAMFVSIATFVLVNVKIFDNKTALESFGIILGLAGCFALFNMFFHVMQNSPLKRIKIESKQISTQTEESKNDLTPHDSNLSPEKQRGSNNKPQKNHQIHWNVNFNTIGILLAIGIFISASFIILHFQKDKIPAHFNSLDEKLRAESDTIQYLKKELQLLKSRVEINAAIQDSIIIKRNHK